MDYNALAELLFPQIQTTPALVVGAVSTGFPVCGRALVEPQLVLVEHPHDRLACGSAARGIPKTGGRSTTSSKGQSSFPKTNRTWCC